ncbi:Uncharacterized protein RA0937 [Sugiyamaella lignohabitans]|uniref:Uncharacterized protein RA0937 n=1 Tax=Sugiyamaella lignohabitans TaxID=796027 RepID=A0A167E1W1_9ASCO|nr:Uncharacterized protein RA0937 [Sugiyamaella lignohabitans]ANB13546.1 Uncharacterized protein RA0937 [Sugiyamaella lignohabitans]
MSEQSPQFHQDKHGGVHVVWMKKGVDGSSRPFVKPRALQYFYDNTLYKTEGERSSGRFEIFLDLLFVGMVANLAHIVTEDPTGLNLLKYLLVGIPAWQMWGDMRDFMNYYYNDDLTQRCLVFWQMCLIVMYGNNAQLAGSSTKYTGLVVGIYIVSRISVYGVIFAYTFYIPEHRKVMRSLATFVVITCGIWLSTIWTPVRVKIALAIVAIACEQFFFAFNYSTFWRGILKATHTTALDLNHEIERYEAFYVIVLGEFLYVIVYESPAQIGFNLKLLRAFFTLLIAYDLNWIYFNGDGSSKWTHALRRSKQTAIAWLYAHMPLNAALVLAADAAGELASYEFAEVAESEHLGEHEVYQLKRNYSFLFCGGIGVGLLANYIISILSKCDDDPGQKWVPKHWRVIWRVPVGITIAFLPFANMSATLLMGIVALLLTVIVTFETLAAWDRVCTEDTGEEIDIAERVENQSVMREGDNAIYKNI